MRRPAPREGMPTLSGYMEMHLNKVQDLPTAVDLHRFVLMVGHSFSDRLKFWSEVEVEHAFVEVEGGEETGEVAIEQAYIDLMVNRRFNLRAGMVLVPVGIVNERHEPPTFHGVERTFVDTVIVPTTWRDTGVGAFGDLGRGFSYRAYAVPGLDAAGFSADEGIAGGRQQGGRADASDPAVTGRLEYRRAGLTAGASLWRGGAGFGLIRLDIETPAVAVSSLDARYRRGRHELRGQWSMVNITGAGGPQSRAADAHRAQPQHREPAARRLCGSGDARHARLLERRSGRVRPLREVRHAEQDAGRDICRSRSFSDRRGWRARRITRTRMSRSSSTSSASATRAASSARPGRVNFGVGWWF